MQKLTIAVLAAALLCGGVYLGRETKDEPKVALRVEKVNIYLPAPASPQAADTDMALASPLGQPVAAKPQLPVNELGRQLLDTKDVRAFVVEALKHPEKGGGFYAMLALRQCANLDDPGRVARQIVADTTTISTDRQQRIDEAVGRCSGFVDGDIDRYQRQAVQMGKDGTDPVMALKLQMQKGTPGTPEYTVLLEKTLTTSMALASENFVAVRLMQQSMSTAQDGSLIYAFNGQKYTDPEEKRAILGGARLASCAPGDYCALDSEMNAICKGMTGTCYASREEYLLQTVYKGDRAAFDKAQVFAEQIRGAMARGDVSIFR